MYHLRNLLIQLDILVLLFLSHIPGEIRSMYFFTIMSPADRAVAIAKYQRIVDNDSFCDYDRNKASRFLRALKAKEGDSLPDQNLYRSLRRDIATELSRRPNRLHEFFGTLAKASNYMSEAGNVSVAQLKFSEEEISIVDKARLLATKGFIPYANKPLSLKAQILSKLIIAWVEEYESFWTESVELLTVATPPALKQNWGILFKNLPDTPSLLPVDTQVDIMTMMLMCACEPMHDYSIFSTHPNKIIPARDPLHLTYTPFSRNELVFDDLHQLDFRNQQENDEPENG